MSVAPKLEGKITPKALGDVLKKLEGNRGAAYLLASDGLSEKCLYFSVGAIRLSSMGKRRGLSLDEALSAHARVEPAMVEAARARQEKTGEPFEEILATEHGLGDVVRECSGAIVRDELFDLFLWDGAAFEYVEANPPPKIFDPRLEAVKQSFGVPKLLKEALEAAPKFQNLLNKLTAKARITRGSAFARGASADPASKAVTDAVPESGIFFEDLIVGPRRAGFDALAITDALESLFERNALDFSKKGQVVEISKEEAAEQARREVLDIEAALDLVINELVARQRLAKNYAAIGDNARAIQNLKIVGDELLLRNKAEDAIEIFREIIGLVPHDFGAREKIVFLYERMKKIQEAIGEGMSLKALYEKFGLLNRARRILQRVIGLDPEDIEKRKDLVGLLLKLNDKDAAVAELEQLGDVFARRQQENDLLAIQQSILEIDPAHKRALEATRAYVRKNPAFWVPYVGVAAGFLILFIFGIYVYTEYGALNRYKEARKTAFERVDAEDYAGAQKAIDEFLTIYDGSRVGPRALALKKQLVELEDERRERRARDEYGKGRRLEEEGKATQAQELYSSVVVNGRGTKWEVEAQGRIREILKVSEDADIRLNKVKTAENNHEYGEAFDKARELVRNKTYAWTDAVQRLEVSLSVQTVPDGASLSIEGRPCGKTPISRLRQRVLPPFTLLFTMPEFEPERLTIDLRKDDVSLPLRVILRRSLRWQATLTGPIEAQPIVEDDAVYVAGRDQHVYALHSNGQLKWAHPLGLFADVAGRPVRAGRLLVVGDRLGGVTVLEAATGRLVFRRQLKGAVTPITAVEGGLVVLAEEGEGLLAIDTTKGAERWRFGASGGLAAAPTPVEGEGTLLVPSMQGWIHVVDALTGAERGRISAKGRPTAPVTVAPDGYLVATDGEVIRLLRRDGSKIWEQKSPGGVVAAPLVVEGAVYVGAGSSLLALGSERGEELWPKKEYAAAIRTTPAFEHGNLYVATSDGAVHSLVAGTGTRRWTYQTKGEVLAQPVVRSDTVYVASTDFNLYAIRD